MIIFRHQFKFHKMKKLLFFILPIMMTFSCNQQEKEHKASELVEDSSDGDLSKFGMNPNYNPTGMEVGEEAPAITMVTATSEEVSLKKLYEEQPLVIIFYRGHWCPACNKHLSEFAERAVEIKKNGAKIIAVTPETYENVEKTISETGLDFMVISDTDGSVMKAFNVNFNVTEDYQLKIKEQYGTSISEANNAQEAVLPVPATYIIDTNGRIVYKQFDPDYTNRASIDDILANLPEDKNDF